MLNGSALIIFCVVFCLFEICNASDCSFLPFSFNSYNIFAWNISKIPSKFEAIALKLSSSSTASRTTACRTSPMNWPLCIGEGSMISSWHSFTSNKAELWNSTTRRDSSEDDESASWLYSSVNMSLLGLQIAAELSTCFHKTPRRDCKHTYNALASSLACDRIRCFCRDWSRSLSRVSILGTQAWVKFSALCPLSPKTYKD